MKKLFTKSFAILALCAGVAVGPTVAVAQPSRDTVTVQPAVQITGRERPCDVGRDDGPQVQIPRPQAEDMTRTQRDAVIAEGERLYCALEPAQRQQLPYAPETRIEAQNSAGETIRVMWRVAIPPRN